MLIDWFTVVAQIINFLILVWLLKRFLYKPILDAIDAREKRIKAELADADAQKAAAQQERDEFEHKNQEFDRLHTARINEVAEEAKAKRSELLDAARKEANELREKMQDALQSEQRSLNEALTLQVRGEVFSIAGKALADLADSSLEAKMTDVLLQRLQSLNDAEQAELKAIFMSTNKPLLVRSTFKLPQPQCDAIETAIKQLFGQDKTVQFKTDPDLVSGIEINADGHKIAWSISAYLSSLSEKVDNMLKIQIKDDHALKAHKRNG